ncbi:MAG: carboxypeptidase regulatory-like domain-containing protein [Acidimicrobiia bacterium]|nr:carboxypeptidase regulatory-like domain-containing protein [Acidimicrobiia bacterium]
MPRAYWAGLAVAALLAAPLVVLQAGQAPSPASVSVDPDDIGGVVTSSKGPEAGVWVIAETDDLPTKFRKIVVTDDQGRFVIPDLPRASYRVWVRGYGLVDSKPVTANPGRSLALTGVIAPTPQAAAQIYPPSYWHSLLEPPPASEFPGTGEKGNGIPTWVKSQREWLYGVKVACVNCHQMGDPVTRSLSHLTGYKNSVEAWNARLTFGQRFETKVAMAAGFGWPSAAKAYADWSDRIARGEVPPQPPRPRGLERNIVIAQWDWGHEVSYIHDMISTDKRDPTINPNGPIYGVDFGRDTVTVLDPVEARAFEVKNPLREDNQGRSHFPLRNPNGSPFWGDEMIWENPISPHNPMMDSKGRIWMTQYDAGGTPDKPAPQPAFCTDPAHPSAKLFPLGQRAGSGFGGGGGATMIAVFDPKTQRTDIIDTCFGTHHLQFDEDDDETLYFSGGGAGAVGWFKVRVWDETKDAAKAQGWCPMVVDANADGKIGDWVQEATPDFSLVIGFMGDARREATPGKDLHLTKSGYGIIVNPVDHSVWHANPGPLPGAIVRYDPKTCLSEIYEPPMNNPALPGVYAATPRGVDVDRNGVIWTALAGSGHTASFDRRKCRVLNGPTAMGQHCPEGWTLYESPGPTFKNAPDAGKADYHYYNWVDQFNTFGLGENINITNGTGSDSLLAVKPGGETTIIRVPYPVGFFTRGLDGRIDDRQGGWKGRGLWANNATNTLWHLETGKGSKGYVAHFQLRPDPLAR